MKFQKRSIFHMALSTLVFLFIDRFIKIIIKENPDDQQKQRRLHMEMALIGTLSIFTFITLKYKGYDPF